MFRKESGNGLYSIESSATSTHFGKRRKRLMYCGTLRKGSPLAVLALSIALLLVCCSSPQQLSLTGTWMGSITFYDSNGSQTGVYSLTANVAQSGSQITGTWSTSLHSSGSLSGVVSDTSIGSLVLEMTFPSAQTFNGSAVVSNNWNTVVGSVVPASGGGTATLAVNRS